jgi:hypothetical protein
MYELTHNDETEINPEWFNNYLTNECAWNSMPGRYSLNVTISEETSYESFFIEALSEDNKYTTFSPFFDTAHQYTLNDYNFSHSTHPLGRDNPKTKEYLHFEGASPVRTTSSYSTISDILIYIKPKDLTPKTRIKTIQSLYNGLNALYLPGELVENTEN